MTRINIIVEGPTEESFIKNVLAPALWPMNVLATPFVLGVPGHKGGNVNYVRVKKDVLLQLKQDKSAYCSTMFDLYGLGDGFPGTSLQANVQGAAKALQIERNVHADIIAAAPPDLRADVRFMPYLQVHEYEALLFSDPATFAHALGKSQLSKELEGIRSLFATPEDIDESSETAPSKRILKVYPAYKKVIEGTIAAQKSRSPA